MATTNDKAPAGECTDEAVRGEGTPATIIPRPVRDSQLREAILAWLHPATQHDLPAYRRTFSGIEAYLGQLYQTQIEPVRLRNLMLELWDKDILEQYMADTGDMVWRIVGKDYEGYTTLRHAKVTI